MASFRFHVFAAEVFLLRSVGGVCVRVVCGVRCGWCEGQCGVRGVCGWGGGCAVGLGGV